MTSDLPTSFAELDLPPPILSAIEEVGYEAPSPIQAAAIPVLLSGRDLLGQAQTGTGKTAAFALPLLGKVDLSLRKPQILVLTPTRELAIQVAEAMQTYARHLPGFHVLPVYGGQPMSMQLRPLRRGVHAVVGTPGRVQDHLRRGTLVLDRLSALVLDEADEMLRMGFVEEVEAILEHTPAEKQVALFSATMPAGIRKIAQRYLRDPVEVRIASKTTTVATVKQRYWPIWGLHKLDALTRILEVEQFDAMLIFVRTKIATVDLAEKLEARGFECAPMNGDMSQALREKTIEGVRDGKIDIVVATDVAARGLDVERISHVVNYDIPHDVDSYVHRIGRTGRAGREGHAILFVATREKRMLRAIETATRQPIERMKLPTRQDIAEHRAAQVEQRITEALEGAELERFEEVIERFETTLEVPARRIAAALLEIVQRDRPIFGFAEGGRDEDIEAPPDRPDRRDRPDRSERPERYDRSDRSDRPERPERHSRGDREDYRPRSDGPREGTALYRVMVGTTHGVEVRDIVGAIAHEAGLNNRDMGKVRVFDTYSTIELPEGMPARLLKHLEQIRVRGEPMNIALDSGEEARPKRRAPRREDFQADESPKRRAPRREDFQADASPRRAPRRDESASDERPARKPRATGGDGPPRRDTGGEAPPRRKSSADRPVKKPKKDKKKAKKAKKPR